MVPCFDEPDLKATWNITVIHPYKTTAISNGMELTSEVDSDRSWVTTKFETTPRMSSYLVAVFVSEFTFNHLETSSGVLFRVWSRPAAINMTSFALRTGVECLAFLEKYFDIPFPLKKQDMIAVPDLLSSAMENWGMITYKESALLYDERIYPQGSEIHVIKLIAHELAHSWFGNLVTMKWWNDLWLNEGFSRYMEHIATTAILRAPRMEDFFLIDVLDTALQSDSRVASQPLLLKAEETADVLEGFGALVYDKGASLIYMIAALMGKESFKKCLQHYLKEHSYSNVETFDLWNALDAEAPKLVGPYAGKLVIRIFADQWTTQNGYPLITAESHNSTSFKVTQSRFKISPETEDPQHAKYGHKWDVPIWYQINREEVKLDWLRRDEPLYITADTARSIIVLNANRYGYYRQNYDIDGWQKLSKQLNENHEVFHTRTRNAIVADAFAAASVAQIDYATLFDLLWYLRNETEYIPLYEALAGLYAIREKLGALRVERDLFNSYLRSLLKYVHKNLQESTRTYKNLGHMYRKDKFFFDSNLKQTVINAYCEAEAKECIDKFATLFLRDVLSCGKYSRASDCVRTPAPLRGNTYCYGIERLGSEAYEKVFEMYMLETVQLEKNTLLGSLACSRNDSYLHRLLQQTFDSDFVRRQDVPVVFSALSKSNGGGKIAFNFLLENWSMIYDSLKNSDSILKNVIKTSLSNANTANELIKLDAFLKHEIGAKYIRWFNEEREKIADRVAWIKKNRDPIVEYLKSIEGA